MGGGPSQVGEVGLYWELKAGGRGPRGGVAPFFPGPSGTKPSKTCGLMF